jgi:hypothetical protein
MRKTFWITDSNGYSFKIAAESEGDGLSVLASLLHLGRQVTKAHDITYSPPLPSLTIIDYGEDL